MEECTPAFLKPGPIQLLLFGGKGGVGKTTCAVAAALHLAHLEPARSILLVSTDPAHSLHDSLAGASLPSNLRVREIDAGEAVRRFKETHGAHLRAIAVRGTFLDPDDASRLLDLSLPGFDEVMAFHEIATLAAGDARTRIIVDTAPTGHTLRLLNMPKLLRTWLVALEAMLGKHRYLTALYRGAYRKDAVDQFLDGMAELLERANSLLGDASRCQFVPVMLAERLSINETQRFLKRLGQWKIPVKDILVNRLCPLSAVCPRCRETHEQQNRELARMKETEHNVFWGIPDKGTEVQGAETLGSFWNDLRPLGEFDRERTAVVPVPPTVHSPAPLPPRESRIVIFAGKGGVGKTTLAAATALRLARERAGSTILLFSTDPAHSLSDCLRLPIGDRETPVAPGVTALEIDAQAAFKVLKSRYVAEVNALLAPASDSAEISLEFDHEALQSVVDLAPPGLDEVMALTRAVELLETGTYDTLVLDAAPTGHFLRLLELPQQIQDWLKVLFGVFLKYRIGARLPRLSTFLVTLSRQLKRLQAILADSGTGRLYVVTILTEMALENTSDLLAACSRMGVHVPRIFINQVTPPSDCPLCQARNDAERKVREHLERSLADYPRSIVYQCTEPRGLEPLFRFGQALYESPVVSDATPEPLLAGAKNERT